MRHKLFSIFLLFVLASTAQAGQRSDFSVELQSAQRALAAGEYKQAYALYARRAAENPLAQFTLGLFHREGWGRPVDPAAACGWFEKAAHLNIPAAQQFFGDCLAGGIGREADGEGALTWYRKAAASGIPYALCSAGILYIEGTGMDKDAKRGLALCAQAAQAESVPAMTRLADYYREGTSVPRDLAAARSWYQRAAERHNREAQFRLGLMLAEGQGGDPDLASALFWLETAAGEGYAPAYLPTAILYANARPDPNTGVLAPEHLAKIYLWNSAAKARTADRAQLDRIAQIEELVLKVMPESWRPGLDRQVAEHLAKHQQ